MLKVIVGSMFSDKSAALINEWEERHHKEMILVIKPIGDTRDPGFIKERDTKDKEGNIIKEGRRIPATTIKNLSDILVILKAKLDAGKTITTILIDEGNFLDGDPTILHDLAYLGDIDIIVGGLNQDRNQKPFGIMPQIMALVSEPGNIIYVTASCNYCNGDATMTIFNNPEKDTKNQRLVGDKIDGYEAVCPKCYRVRAEMQKGLSPFNRNMGLVMRRREMIDESQK